MATFLADILGAIPHAKIGRTWPKYKYFQPHPPSLLYYGTFFVAGYLFHGFKDFLTTCERHFGAYAVASILVFLLSLAPTAFDYRQRGTGTWLHLVAISLNSVLTWLLVYAAIGLFQRFLDRDSPWVAYISQSSYWVFGADGPGERAGAIVVD